MASIEEAMEKLKIAGEKKAESAKKNKAKKSFSLKNPADNHIQDILSDLKKP